MSLIKIFSSWRRRKPQQADNVISNGATASGGTIGCNNAMHMSAHLQQRLIHEVVPHDHQLYCGGGFPGTKPVDEDQQPASVLPQPLNGDYDMQSLQDMMCPIYSSSLLHYNKLPLQRTSDASTDGSAKNCDINLLIYQNALQNAILSVGTLGGELLCQLATEMDNENFNICIEAPFTDNNLIEVDEQVKYCAQTSAPEIRHALDAADECNLLENEIGNKGGATASKTSCGTDHAVLFNTDNSIGRISGIDASNEVQVKMQRKYCTGNTGQEIRCAISTIYSTSVINTTEQGTISPSNAQQILDSSKHTQGSAMGNPLGSIMSASPVGAQVMMDCSSCFDVHEGMMGFSKNAEGIKGLDKASSCSVADTKPVDYLRKDEEELDSENVATPTNFQKLDCISCSHPMDLKRLIIAVTPNYVAKYLFKRLKLGHGQQQLGGQDFNQHCKLYKRLMRMLRINQSRRASTTMKRELGRLAVDHEDHVQGCNNDEEETSVKYNSLQGNSTNVAGISSRAIKDSANNSTSTNTTTAPTSKGMILTRNIENWISTDDEYVVLELEGNRH